VPVLAHPGINVREDGQLLEGIFAAGVQGLEVFSSYHRPAQIEYYKQAALAHGRLLTCGSDFHGKTKPSIQLGSSQCEGREAEIIEALLQAMAGVNH
jgi:hypothetical protein